MRVLVTGSAGHLGEALMRVLPGAGHEPRGLDLAPGPLVDVAGSVADPDVARAAVDGVDAVLHAATLHKPHVGSHSRAQFVAANVSGTLALLEAAVAAGVRAFVFTSTTSTFGHVLRPGPGEPAAWVTEDVVPRPRNIYGVTKLAAEELCELVHHETGLPVLILRTSRFFPEADDEPARRAAHPDLNLKVNELLHRRLDLEDAATAHLCALDRAAQIGFGRYVVSATTPLRPEDATALRTRPAEVVEARCPGTAEVFAARGWTLPADIERVYDNGRARDELGWGPRVDFDAAVAAVAGGRDPRSELARIVGAKGYHDRPTGVYTR